MTAWSLPISILALVVAALTFILRLRSESRDLFLKIHERLLEPDLMEGREVLYGLTCVDDVDQLTKDQRTKLFRLFAVYDVLALYVRQGWISLDFVLSEWADSLRRSAEPGAHFIAWRQRVTEKAWPHYQWLSGLAAHPETAKIQWWRRWRGRLPRRW